MKLYQNSWLKTTMLKKETSSTGFNSDEKDDHISRIRDIRSLSRNSTLSLPVPSRRRLLLFTFFVVRVFVWNNNYSTFHHNYDVSKRSERITRPSVDPDEAEHCPHLQKKRHPEDLLNRSFQPKGYRNLQKLRQSSCEGCDCGSTS